MYNTNEFINRKIETLKKEKVKVLNSNSNITPTLQEKNTEQQTAMYFQYCNILEQLTLLEQLKTIMLDDCN